MLVQTVAAGNPRAAWAARAPELASWAWGRYVNRTDVWGAYNRLEDRGRQYTGRDGKVCTVGKTTTRPHRSGRGKVRLLPADLRWHFEARGAGDVIGLHTTSPDNTSKFGTIEIDHHGEGSSPPAVNLTAALGWYTRLRGRGFNPLLWDSNGKGGFHLDVLLAEPVPTPRLYHLLHGLAGDHARYGLPHQPEAFPKQPRLAPRGDGKPGYGNWVRLIGRHHTRDHWATIWDGTRWLSGGEAVEFILALKGDPTTLVPEVACAQADATAVRQGNGMAAVQRQAQPPRQLPRPAGDALTCRIAKYMSRLPHLALEQAYPGGPGGWEFRKNSKSFGVFRGFKRCVDSSTPGPTRDFE